MADDGVGASSHQSPICSRESEGPPERQEGHHTDRETDELDVEPRFDSPAWVSTDRPEQDATERATEGQEPVVQPPAHPTSRMSEEVGDHDPHLLGEERHPDQAMRLQNTPAMSPARKRPRRRRRPD